MQAIIIFKRAIFIKNNGGNMANKGRVTIDKEQCKGCSNCVSVCPAKILYLDKDNMNSWGYYPASVTDMEKCIGCANCAIMCPDLCIVVERLDNKNKANEK